MLKKYSLKKELYDEKTLVLSTLICILTVTCIPKRSEAIIGTFTSNWTLIGIGAGSMVLTLAVTFSLEASGVASTSKDILTGYIRNGLALRILCNPKVRKFY